MYIADDLLLGWGKGMGLCDGMLRGVEDGDNDVVQGGVELGTS